MDFVGHGVAALVKTLDGGTCKTRCCGSCIHIIFDNNHDCGSLDLNDRGHPVAQGQQNREQAAIVHCHVGSQENCWCTPSNSESYQGTAFDSVPALRLIQNTVQPQIDSGIP